MNNSRQAPQSLQEKLQSIIASTEDFITIYEKCAKAKQIDESYIVSELIKDKEIKTISRENLEYIVDFCLTEKHQKRIQENTLQELKEIKEHTKMLQKRLNNNTGIDKQDNSSKIYANKTFMIFTTLTHNNVTNQVKEDVVNLVKNEVPNKVISFHITSSIGKIIKHNVNSEEINLANKTAHKEMSGKYLQIEKNKQTAKEILIKYKPKTKDDESYIKLNQAIGQSCILCTTMSHIDGKEQTLVTPIAKNLISLHKDGLNKELNQERFDKIYEIIKNGIQDMKYGQNIRINDELKEIVCNHPNGIGISK